MEKVKCRICKGKLYTVLDLGELYISDFLTGSQEGEKSPLSLGECKKCGLIQLEYDYNLDSLYKEHYWYRSGLNKSMLSDLKNIVDDIESKVELNDNDLVIDIGCNDGSLFNFYSNQSIIKVGYDPAPNIERLATESCSLFINNYYSRANLDAKVITSIAMFYDLPDPNKFVNDIMLDLHDDGIWIIQFTDLMSMLKVNAIDNICAEHLEYYKLADIVRLLKRHNLQAIDVSYNKVNGGSIRITVAHKGRYKVDKSVGKALKAEINYLRYNSIPFLYAKTDMYRKFIRNYIKKFNSVYGMAASTKGNTLLQLLKLDNGDILAIGEVNKDKFGLRTAGTNIPIMPEKEVLKAKPDLIIVLAWHFRETFDKVLEDYIEQGGRVLYPLPVPTIISNKGEFILDGNRD